MLKHKAEAISIHALREEGDGMDQAGTGVFQNFYPRPPRGGRPRWASSSRSTSSHFYPRPPRGGRHDAGQGNGRGGHISIHALREEGDDDFADADETPEIFLSTPSARRATNLGEFLDKFPEISIHALREEGDSKV